MHESRKTRGGWRPPKGRWTAKDGAAMMAALASSGLSVRAFAREHGLATHKVSYWRAKLAGDAAEKAGFVALSVAAEPAAGDRERRVEVRLRHGRTLALCGDWDAAEIKPWLAALEATP